MRLSIPRAPARLKATAEDAHLPPACHPCVMTTPATRPPMTASADWRRVVPAPNYRRGMPLAIGLFLLTLLATTHAGYTCAVAPFAEAWSPRLLFRVLHDPALLLLELPGFEGAPIDADFELVSAL